MINYDNHRIKINDKWLIICIGDIASSINDHISLLRYETSMIDVEIFWLLCFDSHSKPSHLCKQLCPRFPCRTSYLFPFPIILGRSLLMATALPFPGFHRTPSPPRFILPKARASLVLVCSWPCLVLQKIPLGRLPQTALVESFGSSEWVLGHSLSDELLSLDAGD